MKDQPKPASNEWTVESVRDLVAAFGTISDVLPFGIIANAHNAALAAAKENSLRDILDWERGYKCGKAECAVVIDELREQLAAEREHTKTLVELLGECRTKLDWSVTDGAFIERIDAALAQEGNWIRAEDNPGFHRHE